VGKCYYNAHITDRCSLLCRQISHEEYDFNGHVMGTLAALKFKAAVKFKVQYVAGFSDVAHGYSYFLTVQPPSFDPRRTNPSSSETESKLIQVSRQLSSPLFRDFNHRPLGWLRGPAVEHWSLADVLSLSCARLVADE